MFYEPFAQRFRPIQYMKFSGLVFLAATFLISIASFGQDHAELQIRFAPADHVFLAQENRFIGLSDFQIQNMVVANLSNHPIKIDEILVEVFSHNDIVKTGRYTGEFLEKSWQMLRSYITIPGMMKEEDPRFRFKELLGDQLTLAETTRLTPKTAIFISRQFYFVQVVGQFVERKLVNPVWPDRVRV